MKPLMLTLALIFGMGAFVPAAIARDYGQSHYRNPHYDAHKKVNRHFDRHVAHLQRDYYHRHHHRNRNRGPKVVYYGSPYVAYYPPPAYYYRPAPVYRPRNDVNYFFGFNF